MKKTFAYILVSFFIIGIALISFNLENTQAKEKEDDITTITTKAWNEFDVLSYSDLSEESKLYFVIADTENKSDIQQMLQKDLDDYNLNNYSLEILKENEVNKTQP